jgi:hypothetical protein
MAAGLGAMAVWPMKPDRLLPLDKQAVDALEALGFSVGDECASAQVGNATVAVRRVSDLRAPEFEFTITFQNGTVLKTYARRRELLAASEGANHEVRNGPE